MVGVSVDQVGRQKEFADENGFGYSLLSDPDKAIAKAFGVKRKAFLPNQRATFVIDQDHTVLAVISSETNMKRHADEALEILSSRSA